MSKLVILCLLGDPMLPAVSVGHTGGFQVDIQELLYNMKNSTFPIHIITNTSPYSNILYEEQENFFVHRIPFDPLWLENQNLLMENFQQIKEKFFEILRNIMDDTLLIHSFYWLSGILAFEAKKEFQINYVHSVVSLAIGKILSGSSPYFSKQLQYEKCFLQNASDIISITSEEKEQLKKYYKIEENQIHIVGRDVHPAFLNPSHHFDGIPNGITLSLDDIKPVELIKYKWWNQGAYTYVGRLQAIKGLPYIIKSWMELYKEYEDRTPPLWICGGTPKNILDFRNQLNAFFDMKELEKYEESQKIVWWGYLDPAGLSTLLMKTRVLVTHSQYEPGGRVLLEAFSASVPVIATPNGFAKDLIKNKENGILVDYGDICALTNAMEYFISSTNNLLKMKKCAHDTYVFQHEKWNCYKKHFEIYRKLGLDCFQ